MSEVYRGKGLNELPRPQKVGDVRAFLLESPFRLITVMLVSSVILLTLSIVFQYFRFYHEGTFPGQRILTFTFNVNREANVPTLFSALQLFLCGFLAQRISKSRRDSGLHDARMWKIFGGVFYVMAVEEILSARSLLTYGSAFVTSEGMLGGALHFSWVVPGLILVVGLVAYFAGFALRLPARVRALIFFSGMMYLAGSLGLEMISGVWIESYGRASFVYSLLTSLEEAAEMFAISIVAFALLEYLGSKPES